MAKGQLDNPDWETWLDKTAVEKALPLLVLPIQESAMYQFIRKAI